MTEQTAEPLGAVAGQVERPVGRPVEQRASTCEQGCNGCDECTDYDDPENDPPAREASDWAPPLGYDGDGSVAAMARRAERPEFGTAPIRCGRIRCKWRGFETLLTDKKDGMFTRKLCPLCGCDSYMFMTPGEIKAWERSKTPNVEGEAHAHEQN